MTQPLPITNLAPRAVQRVGDLERSATCDELSAQFAAGRLSDEELDQRLSFAVNARTRGDLHRLLIDLPPLAGPAPAATAPVPAPMPPLPVRPVWTVLDILSLLALIGALPLALLGAMIVIGSFDQSTAWVAVFTTLVAGTIGAASVHLTHRGWSRHDARVRAELRASGDDSRR